MLFSELCDLFDCVKNDNSRSRVSHAFDPGMNISKTDDGVLLEVAVPGIEAKDLQVSIEDNLLTIKGKRDNHDKKYIRMDMVNGAFEKRMVLADKIDTNKITSKLENGILNVSIPYRESCGRTVEIK